MSFYYGNEYDPGKIVISTGIEESLPLKMCLSLFFFLLRIVRNMEGPCFMINYVVHMKTNSMSIES